MGFIQAMGAEHVGHEKLVRIVRQIQRQMHGISPMRSMELDRVNDTYHIDADHLWKDMGYIPEEKIDGYSYVCNNGRFFSRKLSEAKGKEGTPIEKSDRVPHLVGSFEYLAGMCDHDIHGELYVPGGTSDDVTMVMGCAPDKAIARQRENGWLHYMIHDIRRYNGVSVVNEPWYVRRALLEFFYNTYIVPTDIQGYVHLSQILGDPEREFHRIVSGGGEGIILKNTSAIYVPGKKPANVWIKCKREITLDVVITGYNMGTGKNAKLFGSMSFGVYDNGVLKDLGNVSSGIDDATRVMIASDPDGYIGKVIEIRAMQEGKASLRHPRFVRLRDDKPASECTLDTITPVVSLL